jgi:hypothetical protein
VVDGCAEEDGVEEVMGSAETPDVEGCAEEDDVEGTVSRGNSPFCVYRWFYARRVTVLYAYGTTRIQMVLYTIRRMSLYAYGTTRIHVVLNAYSTIHV